MKKINENRDALKKDWFYSKLPYNTYSPLIMSSGAFSDIQKLSKFKVIGRYWNEICFILVRILKVYNIKYKNAHF